MMRPVIDAREQVGVERHDGLALAQKAGPVGDVLQAGITRLEEVGIHRRRIVADLDQLDLQGPRIRQRHRIVRLIGFEIEDRSRIGRPPENGVAIAKPGEDAFRVGF
jgi:hypothetical protein